MKEEISSSRLKSWEAAISDQEVTTMNSLSHLDIKPSQVCK